MPNLSAIGIVQLQAMHQYTAVPCYNVKAPTQLPVQQISGSTISMHKQASKQLFAAAGPKHEQGRYYRLLPSCGCGC
jgi:hypothetical protein